MHMYYCSECRQTQATTIYLLFCCMKTICRDCYMKLVKKEITICPHINELGFGAQFFSTESSCCYGCAYYMSKINTCRKCKTRVNLCWHCINKHC